MIGSTLQNTNERSNTSVRCDLIEKKRKEAQRQQEERDRKEAQRLQEEEDRKIAENYASQEKVSALENHTLFLFEHVM
jgi:hypothetical protein